MKPSSKQPTSKKSTLGKPPEFTLYRLIRRGQCPRFSLEPPATLPPGSELETFKVRLTPQDVVDALNNFGLRHEGERMVDAMVRSLNAGAIRDGLGPDPDPHKC